jgi:gliding motility-associated-like protein
MYKWGREKEMINGAIMRIFKNSELSINLLNEIANGPAYTNSIMWSSVLYQKVYTYNKSWTIFPSAFFNSEWQDSNLNLWNPMKVYDFKMYVFNRWGQLIFTAKDISDRWNGFYKGELCQNDIYVYKAFYKDRRGKEYNKIIHTQ